MTTPASFWAAKSNEVKSSNTVAHVDNSTVPRRLAYVKSGTLKKKLPPLQSQHTRDSSLQAFIGTKKTSWADSYDEDDLLSSPISSERVDELENAMTADNDRTKDLLASLEETTAHITKLESTKKSQEGLINHLQVDAKVSTVQIEELKKENHKQFLYIKELTAVMDEKDRRITYLENEVEEHRTRAAELDTTLDADELSTHIDNLSASPQDAEPIDEGIKAKKVHNSDNVVHQKPKEISTCFVASQPLPNGSHTKTPDSGPAVNTSKFPIFATAATIKQTAIPPPAPKLTMAIDLSKFAKKPATSSVAPKKSDSAQVEATTGDTIPKVDPNVDIRSKSREERKLFAKGPRIQVKMGDETIGTVPKYVLMQCSAKAFKQLTSNPSATTFEIPADSVDAIAAAAHLDWMKEMTYQGHVWSITLHADPKFDDRNLQICRASRVLGLNNMYVGHFTRTFCDRIRSDPESYDFLSKVALVAFPTNDPVYDCLANNLATMLMRNTAKKPEELKMFLDKFPDLKTKVEKIKERAMNGRHGSEKGAKGAKGAKGDGLVHVGKNMDD